jgi:hypothetical protein
VNRVELQFPEGVKFEEQDRPVFTLSCARPAKDQRLHLVVIGPGQADPAPLVRRVRQALQADHLEGDPFRTPAFREGRVYPPLYGDVNREQVYAALIDVRHRIRATAGPLNDVVIVYFQGEETVRGGRQYLLTEQSRKFGRLDKTALDCDTMRDLLSEVPGARLLLLDVTDPAQGPDRGRPGGNAFPHIGLYRYVWLGNQAVPADAQFLHALELSLARAGPLRDVKHDLQTFVIPVARKYQQTIGANISLNLYNSPPMDELLVGITKK